MDNRLTITHENVGEQVLLKLQGRLDANNATYLDDKLTELIQEGKYHVSLDTEGIVFLSSAGIRILVKQSKAFRIISGELCITRYSEGVRTVLEMVGMTTMFSPKGITVQKPQEKGSPDLERFGYRFIKTVRVGVPLANLTLLGNPDKISDSSFTNEDSRKLRLDKPFFGLGIGAFGDSFEDCKSHYGEFIALGEGVASLPSDNTKTPDYMIRTGNLIPDINILYCIGINDNFQYEIQFTPETETSITIGEIAESIAETCNHKNFAMLMISESSGLVGASIKTSPTSGMKPFSFPEVRERVKFTTEPAHIKAMVITFGIFSVEPEEKLKKFLRTMNNTGKLLGHVHSAVFTYTPLQKENIDYKETISHLFEESDILDVLHLLNDNREINGVGESSFRSGHCWTTEIAL